jgi:hypothetical protein
MHSHTGAALPRLLPADLNDLLAVQPCLDSIFSDSGSTANTDAASSASITSSSPGSSSTVTPSAVAPVAPTSSASTTASSTTASSTASIISDASALDNGSNNKMAKKNKKTRTLTVFISEAVLMYLAASSVQPLLDRCLAAAAAGDDAVSDEEEEETRYLLLLLYFFPCCCYCFFFSPSFLLVDVGVVSFFSLSFLPVLLFLFLSFLPVDVGVLILPYHVINTP